MMSSLEKLWVGRDRKTEVGGRIQQRGALLVTQRLLDISAARGVVCASPEERFASIEAARNQVRAHLGAEATMWHVVTRRTVSHDGFDYQLLISPHGREILERVAAETDEGVIGYVHEVDPEGFEQYYPNSDNSLYVSRSSALVKEARPVTLDQLPDLSTLPDPMQDEGVRQDARVLLASGVFEIMDRYGI
jgi:hypothetical protein